MASVASPNIPTDVQQSPAGAAAAPGTWSGPTPDAQPWWKQAIQSLTGKPVGQGGGGAALSDVGNLSEAIQRFMVQRTLQNPADVLKNSQVLSGGLSKALAPYRYRQQQQALQDYLAAMHESMGAYPGTSDLFGPGGYGSYPSESSTSAAS